MENDQFSELAFKRSIGADEMREKSRSALEQGNPTAIDCNPQPHKLISAYFLSFSNAWTTTIASD
jgi:hypothetical protein